MYILEEPAIKKIITELENILKILQDLRIIPQSNAATQKIVNDMVIFGNLIHVLNSEKTDFYFRHNFSEKKFEHQKRFFDAFREVQAYFFEPEPNVELIAKLFIIFNLLLELMKKYFYQIWSVFDSELPEGVKKTIEIKQVVDFKLSDLFCEYRILCIRWGVVYDWKKLFLDMARRFKTDKDFFDDSRNDLNNKYIVKLLDLLKTQKIEDDFLNVFQYIIKNIFLSFDDESMSDKVKENRDFLLKVYFCCLAHILFDEEKQEEYLNFIKELTLKKPASKDSIARVRCCKCFTFLDDFKQSYPPREIAGQCALYPICDVIVCNVCFEKNQKLKKHRCHKARGMDIQIFYFSECPTQHCFSCKTSSFKFDTCQAHDEDLLCCCFQKMMAKNPFFNSETINWCIFCNPLLKQNIGEVSKKICTICNNVQGIVVSECKEHSKKLFKCYHEKKFGQLSFEKLAPQVWCEECIKLKPERTKKKVGWGVNQIKDYYKEAAPSEISKKDN